MYANIVNPEETVKIVAITFSVAGSGVVGLYHFFIWLMRRMERRAHAKMVSRVQARFVHEVATNHLPHIYNANVKIANGIKQIGTSLGIDIDVELDDAPPIRFVPYAPDKDSE